MKIHHLFDSHARRLQIFVALVSLAVALPARATFHLMQIEQVIGGVNGDTSAQAIQLRMRTFGQNLVTGTTLIAVDASGNNPITLVTLPSIVGNNNAAARILITTASFASHETTPIASDFTMTNAIPASYLAAGRLIYSRPDYQAGAAMWSVSWGGASYTGPNAGTIDNDADGDFAPPFAGPLPSDSTMALRFNGAASALSTNNAADYSVTVGSATFTNNAGASTSLLGGTASPTPTPSATVSPSPTASPTPTPSPTAGPTTTPSTLGNISTRLRVLAGDNALIGGLIATGTGDKRVIIRAIGPSLTGFGVPGALANPTLDLFQGSTLLMNNDDWQTSPQQAEIAATGLAPSNPAESAIIFTLTPGQTYTAVVRGSNNTTGIGVVEAFDLNQGAGSKLGNISTRGFVDVDDNVMIAGLIASPANGTNFKVLVRALGPSLTAFGVANALPNPTLDLVNASGTVIRSNNDWKDDPQQRALIEGAGLAPGNDLEAALVETVPPGAYTAVVRGNNRTTGVGLVEAYNIP
jgi:hypothetical protein